MINFLSPEAKSAVRREYLVRVASMWTLLVSAVAAVTVLLLLPTYALLARELDALAIEVVQTESDAGMQEYKTTRTAFEKAQTLAVQLALATSGPSASEILYEIQKAQTRSIALSGFSYTHTGTTTAKVVTVRGIAATRAALTEFSAALERSPLFVRAEVPVSNLAEEQNLPFTLTIVLAPDTL